MTKVNIVHPGEKKLRRKNVSIDDDKKRENESVENSLMEKVKIENKFLMDNS